MVFRSFRFFFIWAVAAMMCVTCAPRPKPEPAPFPKSRAAADKLFQQAENRYQSRAFPEALTLYRDYVSRYPDESSAPAALMRMGSIYTSQGDAVAARKAYGRIISDYPSSPLRAEAALENLNSLAREGHYQDVVAQSAEALKWMTLPVQRARVWTMKGDAQAALEERMKAVEAYTQALQQASPSDQEMIVPKLRSAILRLGSDDVRQLSQRTDHELPIDYLLFQAGMLFAREGRAQDALVLFNAFRERFPGHRNAQPAEQAMAEILRGIPVERRQVGCLLPLSGSYQGVGQRALRGIELAVSLHNASKEGASVHMIVKDTASDAAQTLRALHELERENVFGVIGPMVHAETVSPEAQRMGMPMMAITQKEGVTGVGDYVFRNFLTPQAQVRSLVSYAVEKLGVTQAVVLYPDENYGRTFMGLFRDELQARGGEILTAVAYSPEATDFSAPIKKLLRFSKEIPKRAKAELKESRETGARRSRTEEKNTERVCDFQAIFIPDEPRMAGMLVPQLVYHDIKNVYLFGTNLWHSETLIRLAETYVQGAIMADAFFAASVDPHAQRFVSAFEETYQERPGFIEAVAYDSAMILFDVVGRPGVRLRRDVAAALRNSEGFPGATGRTRFNARGEPEKSLHILEVRGAKFAELE
jgi:ABC-type branched-subunit amino acid transport system substrate-binding protein/predicted negative regulator of RcsB-dependent stress response